MRRARQSGNPRGNQLRFRPAADVGREGNGAGETDGVARVAHGIVNYLFVWTTFISVKQLIKRIYFRRGFDLRIGDPQSESHQVLRNYGLACYEQ